MLDNIQAKRLLLKQVLDISDHFLFFQQVLVAYNAPVEIEFLKAINNYILFNSLITS